ncbi:uncharacterized protein N7479_001722 [Penicillium vulpinum]|uniref:uncharacterized protein n=1 Tax=Penicillium vulpinum TaxID=29845 RepID=UPI0025485FFC|nr:uncharacterized protein N7479_001722 [Penicillium vulpinum]KAJ5971804.1 hypothetical protein N7479_001722 [Penicillium vulpinum]
MPFSSDLFCDGIVFAVSILFSKWSLTAEKIQELLVICGISNCCDEPIKQHILGISDFIRQTRQEVGITDPPPLRTPTASPDPEAKHGSYRFLPTPEKRSRADYTGLDAPSHKKKRKNKVKAKDKTTLKEMSQGMNDAVPPIEGNIPTDSPSTDEANTAMNLPRAGTPLTDVYTHQGGKVPHSIVENILVNCIKLNDPLGRYGHCSKQAIVTTKVEAIQSFVDGIVKLQYPDAVQLIKQENAFSASKSIQSRFNETVYWEIIKKGAELLDPKDLPTSKGPLDEFTMAEKVATERFMREAGYGLSLANQRQCRLFWKRLFEMRNAGVDKILLYRTKEFDRFCKSYSSEAGASLVEMVRNWEKRYAFHIKQLEERVVEESKGGFTGRLWLSQSLVADRLRVPENAWNSATNPWFSSVEETVFQLSGSHEPSAVTLGGFFDLQPKAETMRNKSIFVILQPKDDVFLTVSAPGGDSNVRLRWELIDGRGEGHLMWKVSVVALRAIQPFEELVRAAPQKEQYLLHQSPACAKRGYTKYQSS